MNAFHNPAPGQPELWHLDHSLTVFGLPVTSVPEGIPQAYETLDSLLSDKNRLFVGIGTCTPEGMYYLAAAEETFPGEGTRLGCTTAVVEPGTYLSLTVTNWRTWSGTEIQGVFRRILEDGRADAASPAIELYESDTDLRCLVRALEQKGGYGLQKTDLKEALEHTFGKLLLQIGSFPEDVFNTRTTPGTWTPGQVARHLLLSNTALCDLVLGPTEATLRKPDQWVAQIRDLFLDRSAKMEAPDFTRPEEKFYEKQPLQEALSAVGTRLAEAAGTLDPTATCTAFELPGVGRMTRMEALHFSRYHTERHLKQLEERYRELAGTATTDKAGSSVTLP